MLGSYEDTKDFRFRHMRKSLSFKLASEGIAVLQLGGRANNDSIYINPAFLSLSDREDDIKVAIKCLKADSLFAKASIGLIGFGFGGVSAAHVAGTNKDISFLITMSTYGIPGDECLYWFNTLPISYPGRMKLEDRNNGAAFIYNSIEIIKNNKDKDISTIKEELASYYDTAPSFGFEGEKDVEAFTTAKTISIIRYEPTAYFADVKVPTLVVQGINDGQMDWKTNMDGIEKVFIRNRKSNYKMLSIMHANHYYMESNVTIPAFAIVHYSPKWEPKFVEEAWNGIAKWIQTAVTNEE
jgi:alpha/beta superfamily hydrolase